MKVTILILIDGFLQLDDRKSASDAIIGHNPYFNRWFSAILYSTRGGCYYESSHNPYFNRWFSAI